jgi:hypothetical protein
MSVKIFPCGATRWVDEVVHHKGEPLVHRGVIVTLIAAWRVRLRRESPRQKLPV